MTINSSLLFNFKYLLKFIIPYHLVVFVQKRRQSKTHLKTWEEQKKDLFTIGWLQETQAIESAEFSYKEAISFLETLNYESLFKAEDELAIALQPESGLDGIIPGSIPESSLDFCASLIKESFTGQPIIGLHIGNFVGISLSYITYTVKKLHPESIIVSIDPNIKHRDIRNPLNIVVGLLNKFGLQENSLILTGYSLEMNSYYDAPSDNNPPTYFFDRGLSCTHQLTSLAKIAPKSFDFFLIDGNHEGNYLKKEIEIADELLKVGGLLILDDVNSFWSDIQETYQSIDETKYCKLGTDGRVGILKKIY